MGHAADLLLPHFPDERWVELSNPQHSYGQHLISTVSLNSAHGLLLWLHSAEKEEQLCFQSNSEN